MVYDYKSNNVIKDVRFKEDCFGNVCKLCKDDF